MKTEITPLTGLRGIAAVIVMAYHFGQPFNTLGIDTHFHVRQGYLAVDLFFVLSGFVLAYNYAHDFAAPFEFRRFREFLVRRAARLFPAYYAVGGVFLIKMAVNFAGDNRFLAFGPADIIGNLLMLTGWGLGIEPVVVDSWSVSAELFAYLVFPWLLRLVFDERRAYAAGAAVLALGVLALVAALGHGERGPLDVVFKDSALPLLRCLAGFTLGLIACRLWQDPQVRAVLGTKAGTAVVFALLGLGTAAHGHDLLLVALFPVLVIALACDRPIGRAAFANPAAVFLGEISYSLYLVHDTAVTISVRLAKMAEGRFGVDLYPMMAIAGMIVSCGIAWACYRWVEIPGKRIVIQFARRATFISAN